MPLEHSGTDAALERNLHTLKGEIGRSPHVQSWKQALAIGLETQRRNRDTGGGIQGPFFLTPAGSGSDSHMSAPPSMSPPSPSQSVTNGPATGTLGPTLGGTNTPSSAFSAPPAPSMAGIGLPWGGASTPWLANMTGMGALTGMPRFGAHRGGTIHRQGGGMAPPWYVRNEARQMGHTGPINSPVSGRTDHIPLRVPVGSYVIPADIISGRGQGNSAAGQSIMHKMFSSGPMGMSLPKMGHGASLPKAPRPMGALGMGKPPKMFAEGGSTDEDYQDTGETVPIMAAGNEYVVHPKTVWMIGGGNIALGHKILDQWVKDERANLVKTLKGLPGPAKD